MKFLIDAQLPPVLADFFRLHGHEADNLRDLGLREARDAEIWGHATKTASIIVTKDEDFVIRRVLSKDPHEPAVLWLRVGNVKNPVLTAWLNLHWTAIEEKLNSGEKLIEVR